jgi:AhpC/TSA family protein
MRYPAIMSALVRAAGLTVALVALPSVAPLAIAEPDFTGARVEPYTPATPAPAFSLPDLAGLPSVQKIYQDFRGKGLEVLLIDIKEDPDQVRRTVKERRYIAPVLLDQNGDVSGTMYRVWGPPTVFIVDRQGRLVGRAGARSWDSPKGRQFTEAMLASPATP